jgi:hypothetical protein
MNLRLSDTEVAAIRALPGSTAFVAILAARGPRGAKYRPVRSAMWRTEEQAAKALAGLRRRYLHGRQLLAFDGVYLVDATGEAIEVEGVEIPVLPPQPPVERLADGTTVRDVTNMIDRILDRLDASR